MSPETKQPMKEHDTELVEVPSQKSPPIGPATPIQLGIFVTLLAAVSGGAWALSSLNTKVDMVLSQFKDMNGRTEAMSKALDQHKDMDATEWNGIKARVMALETSGSEKARELEKRLNVLETDFRVFQKIQEKAKP